MAPPSDWTRRALTRAGFEGWVPWSACPGALEEIPTAAAGVYLFFREEQTSPSFLERTTAGTWREDPTVPLATLELNWVPGAQVLFVDSAPAGRLRKVLRDDVRFGRGARVRFSDSRIIWQLADAERLLVAWQILDDDTAAAERDRLVESFRAAYVKRPFANDPKLMGK